MRARARDLAGAHEVVTRVVANAIAEAIVEERRPKNASAYEGIPNRAERANVSGGVEVQRAEKLRAEIELCKTAPMKKLLEARLAAVENALGEIGSQDPVARLKGPAHVWRVQIPAVHIGFRGGSITLCRAELDVDCRAPERRDAYVAALGGWVPRHDDGTVRNGPWLSGLPYQVVTAEGGGLRWTAYGRLSEEARDAWRELARTVPAHVETRLSIDMVEARSAERQVQVVL